jgi:hypothetical protein
VVLGDRERVESGCRGELPALDRLRDRDEFVRIGRRQIAKEHAVQDGENAGVDADAQGERDYRNDGKQRVLAESAQAVANVLPERGPRPDPDLADILAGQQHVANRSPAGIVRVCGVRPSRSRCAARSER